MGERILKIVVSLLVVWMSLMTINETTAQNYVLLPDASGFDRSGYVGELEAKSSELLSFFENDIDANYGTNIKDNFKLFDFGFYLFNPITDGGIENALQIAEAQASQSSYYILFSKESSSEGIYSKIHIDIKLPLGVNICSTAEKLEQIENVLQEVANSFLDGNPFNYPIAVSETIDAALLMFGSIYCCEENGFTSNNNKSRSSACSVYSADQLGFLTFHNLTTTKTEFCKYSNDLEGLIERYNQCVMEDWLTYPEILNYTNNSNSCAGEIDKGIIPICLVENLAIQNGIPEVEFGRFAAGIVDGAYASIESIPDAVKGIGTLIEKGIEVQDAFTWAWLRCNPIFYKLNYQQCLEYEELIANGELGNQNDPNDHLGGLFQRIKSKSKAEYYDILVTYINDCDSKADLRNDVISFFTDFENIKSIFKSIRDSIGEYIDSFNEDTRAYCSGRLVGNIIVGILGDKGLSKVANLLSAFNKIQNALGPIMRLDGFPTDLLDDYAKLVKKFPNDFNKIPTSIIDEFVTDVATLEKFLDDFTSNPTFKNHILGLTDPLPQVKAWKILDDAGRNALKLNTGVLAKVSKILDNPKLDDFLPINTPTRNITTREEMVQQMVNLQGDASKIVGSRMSSMGDLMDEVDHFLVDLSDKPGAFDFIKELTESDGKMAGGSFVLKAIKNQSNELGTITKFESTVSSSADDIGDIVVDVITSKGSISDIFNEFKNWKAIPSNRYSSFTKQFSGYITNKNFGEFFYNFKKGVGSNGFLTLESLKTDVISAFSSTAGRGELSNIPLGRIRNILGDPGITEAGKVQALIDHLDDFDNFEDIFKLFD